MKPNSHERNTRDRVLTLLEENKTGLSCAEICHKLINRFLVNKKEEDITNTVSSILSAMVKQSKIKISMDRTSRNGNIYILKD